MRQKRHTNGPKISSTASAIFVERVFVGGLFSHYPRRQWDAYAIYKRLVRLPRAQRHQANY